MEKPYSLHICFWPEEAWVSVEKMTLTKACILDQLSAEHLRYANQRAFTVFYKFSKTWQFTCVYVISTFSASSKRKNGKISINDNYRPIALASVLTKRLEDILIERVQECITHFDIMLNLKKSCVIIATTKVDQKKNAPSFYLSSFEFGE